MSADFRTEHFKGWQHDGYVHVARVDGDRQEYPLGDLTAEEVDELASMFTDAEPELASAGGHVHDWKVHGKQTDTSVNPTGGHSVGNQTTVALMRCAVCGDIKTETLRGQWDMRYLTGEWTEER
jgi:hypothetical protein